MPLLRRHPAFIAPSTIEAGLELAAVRAKAMGADEIILAGGSEIFAALIDRVDRMYVTFVHAAPEGDAVFPPIDWSQWQEIRREDHQPQKGDEAAFSFVDFIRRGA